MSVSIGVVGATGQVGGVMLDLLADDPGFEIDTLRLFASARSAGKVVRALVGTVIVTAWVLPEIVEYPDHPWFIGVQFHPELKSKPFAPHPLFAGFVGAAVRQARLV